MEIFPPIYYNINQKYYSKSEGILLLGQERDEETGRYLTQYAEIDEAHVDALLQEELRKNRKKLVVLDDDPTRRQRRPAKNIFS